MKTRPTLRIFTRTILPLLATGMTALLAEAAVTPIQAGADTQTHVGVGQADRVGFGPSDVTLDVVADPYVVSRFGDSDERGLSEAQGVARSAVQVNSADKVDFFVSSSSSAGRTSAQLGVPYAAHGSASGSAFYDFAIDKSSILSLSFAAFSEATSAANAYIALNVFSYGTHSYLRQGIVSGVDAASYTLPAGRYDVTFTAFSEGFSPALTPVSDASGNAIGNLSLAVSVQAVPEPASWVLLLSGGAAIGLRQRKRRPLR